MEIHLEYGGLTEQQKNRFDKIDSLKSDKGGWTKKSLAQIGVSWPPEKGWLHNYILNEAKGE